MKRIVQTEAAGSVGETVDARERGNWGEFQGVVEYITTGRLHGFTKEIEAVAVVRLTRPAHLRGVVEVWEFSRE